MTRRPILVAALALGAALAGAFASAQTASQATVRGEKLTDGVWASPTPGGSNVGWFDIGGVVVAVDTGANESAAQLILDEIAKTAGAKPRYVVLTHAHRDHAGGARAFAAAGVQVISAEKAATGALVMLEGGAESAPKGQMLMTVSERMLLVGGGARRAEIYYLGPGHTQGDLIVYLPDAGVLFSGDLAVNGVLPFLRSPDVDPDGWEKILQRLAALRIDKMVPGHGAIGPRNGIEDTAVYVRRVNEIAEKIVKSGLPAELWEAQVRDPVNEIPNVSPSPDHIANVRAIAERQKNKANAPPAAAPGAPASRPTPRPTPRAS